ncbi:MAG: type II secretion system F family protein [Candidatus Omnitrophica bacterium]|nr:type II secretion system F family protein [Candidatus Omnitrophota bacterium]
MLILILIFVFFSIGLISSVIIPSITARFHRVQRTRISQANVTLEKMFVLVPSKKLLLLYTISPLFCGIIAVLLFQKGFTFIIGIFLGFFVPELIIKILDFLRKRKIDSQLVDALNNLSSSFKGGLSLLQAMEIVSEEMPPPIAQEFSLVVRENKVGVPLDESLLRLNKRVGTEEMELMINSILVARETGGDLAKVFHRLANSLRDRRKLKEHMTTLTLQGKIQGLVMSVLPIVFVTWVASFSKGHFDIMLQKDLGRLLLLIAGVLQITGMYLIYRFSRIDF